MTKDDSISYGVIENDTIAVIEGDILGQWQKTDSKVALEEVKLLAPIMPPNLLAIGWNYKEHADESNRDLPKQPRLFIKATSAVIDPEESIVLPKMAPDNVDFEAELAVIIGKPARGVSEKEALDYVFGYTCGNDVSARNVQFGDKQWARGKSFETFAPLGPWIETELDPAGCNVRCRVNGRVMQDGNTSLMIFDVPYLISYLSQGMTLLPGTVIMSGTPSGVGFARKPPVWLKPGDVVEVEVENIGILRNPVIEENTDEI